MKTLILVAVVGLACLFAGRAVGDTLSSPPFTIEYSAEDTAVARDSATLLHAAVKEYAPRLPIGDKPIQVVIAGTRTEFVRRVGYFGQLRVAGVARPADGLIIVQSPRIRMEGEDFNGTLRHELLHVLLHRNTDTEALPRWLNEGLCMSYANEYYWQATTSVAKMFIMGRVIPLDKLDRAFSAPGDDREFGDAYAQALTLVRFMRDHLGEEAFWQTVLGVRGQGFEASLRTATGMDTQGLWSGYHRSLWFLMLIGAVTSGGLLGPAALLVVVAWWRIRVRNRARLAVMEEAERHEPIDVSWAELGAEDDEEEEEPRRLGADSPA